MTTSLTTDPEQYPAQDVILTSSATTQVSCGKVKTVVSQLVKQWRQLISSECNVKLFSNLLSKNISTRNIHSFVSKQAHLRKIHKCLETLILSTKQYITILKIHQCLETLIISTKQ